MKYLLVLTGVVCLSFMLLPACAPQPQPEAAPEPVVDLQAEEAAIRELDKRNMEAYNNKDLETLLGSLAEDHVAHEPNVSPIVGREAQRPLMEEFFKVFVSINWEIEELEISTSGDMAYILGTYHVVIEGSEDQVEVDGKYINVLKKINGEWKYVVFSGSSNQPSS